MFKIINKTKSLVKFTININIKINIYKCLIFYSDWMAENLFSRDP